MFDSSRGVCLDYLHSFAQGKILKSLTSQVSV